MLSPHNQPPLCSPGTPGVSWCQHRGRGAVRVREAWLMVTAPQRGGRGAGGARWLHAVLACVRGPRLRVLTALHGLGAALDPRDHRTQALWGGCSPPAPGSRWQPAGAQRAAPTGSGRPWSPRSPCHRGEGSELRQKTERLFPPPSSGRSRRTVRGRGPGQGRSARHSNHQRLFRPPTRGALQLILPPPPPPPTHHRGLSFR